jgi:hypothetical protein
MGTLFLEIVFDSHDCAAKGFDRFEELEEALDASLSASKLGERTGDGSGSDAAIIEVEVSDDARVDEAISLLRRTLQHFAVPPTTVIKRYEPEQQRYPAYG